MATNDLDNGDTMAEKLVGQKRRGGLPCPHCGLDTSINMAVVKIEDILRCPICKRVIKERYKEIE